MQSKALAYTVKVPDHTQLAYSRIPVLSPCPVRSIFQQHTNQINHKTGWWVGKKNFLKVFPERYCLKPSQSDRSKTSSKTNLKPEKGFLKEFPKARSDLCSRVPIDVPHVRRYCVFPWWFLGRISNRYLEGRTSISQSDESLPS